MTSSMLSGDRRWASSSARRGGLTVLGKVVVPKPINLPSQRSENHGLDPNVEIVPKGTLSWGSRSSSAWGSLSLSPNTDGGGSPSHLSGRPSSGSGTRPSTASSDRAHESVASIGGPDSRPASASGALTSNQTSLISLRPRSAETRPGSSQLSRFAEHSEYPVAWNAAGTAEKLGVTPPKNDGFSLASGDFPTLGSGKENSGRNADTQDQSSRSRPSSSSSGVGTAKERIGTSGAGDLSSSDVKNGAVNSWKRDNPPYSEDGGRPGVEKWQGNPQSYPAPPQHYDGWHGVPMNNPQGGVWFRGPPGGPYGNPVAPAGFPMEPFPYYRPQIPAAGLPNPQPVPAPGAGPRGPHPKNGDMYRPHMPDAYIRPGLPIRPGFYPGPVAYEGYYGPPMGYCSSNERDVQFIGMAAGPSVYNRYPGQGAPEPGNSHGRSGGYIGEQVESGHPQDNRGPYKVLLKQHDGWDRETEEHRSDSAVAIDASRRDQPRTSSWENYWRSDHEEGERERDLRKEPGEEASFQNFDNQGAPSVPVKTKSLGSGGNMKAIDDISGKKLESDSFGLSNAPQPLLADPKDSSLIQKIEGLNAKARASDGRNENMIASSGEVRKNKFQANAKANQNRNESGGSSLYPERTHTTEIIKPYSHKVGMSSGDKHFDSTAGIGTNISRRSTNSTQSRADHYGKGRFTTQEVEGWQKKPSTTESPTVVSAVHLETSNIHMHDHHRSTEATENSGSLPHGKLEEQSVLPMSDLSDNPAQRAKMKELAKQKTKQLQEEEEERTKKQMAKALAKLEELNRRTQVVEESTQKLENASSGTVQNKQEESQPFGESSIASRSYGPPKAALGSNSNVVPQVNESYTSGVEKSCLPCSELPSEARKSATGEPERINAQSVPLKQEVDSANAVHHVNAPQVHESNVSKQKRTGSKQKQATTIEVTRTWLDVEHNVNTSLGVEANEGLPSGGSTIHENLNASADSSLHLRKKNSKNGKNKHKVEDTSIAPTSSSFGSKENLANVSLEGAQPKSSEFQLDPGAVQLQTTSRGADRPSEQRQSSPNEDSHGRANSQWKPQQSRRMQRNPQGNRPTEKFHGSDAVVWAPVRSQNKPEVTDEASPTNVVDGVSASVKSDQVQNNSKNKRAEMERYVPKPVAKEMAQHGSNQNPVASVVNQTTTDESIVRAGSEISNNTGMVVGKTGFSAEPRNGSSRHSKQGKAHGSWRQRGSTESASSPGLQDGPTNTANLGQNVQKPIEHHHPQKSDASSVKEQQKFTDGWDTTDDWGISDNSSSVEPVLVPTVKDQGIAARGKRHGFKGHKGIGNNRDLDQKKSYSGETDKNFSQSLNSENNHMELSSSSKENRAIGERSMSHWQPKAQALSNSNQRGSRHNISHNAITEVAWANKTESSRHGGVSPPPTHDKDAHDSSGQIHYDQSIFERKNAEEAPNVRQQEPKRERKSASLKGNPQLPNQGPSNPIEPLPVNLDVRQEQLMSSGVRKSGNQNGRFNKSHESRGDLNYSGQDNKQHNPSLNRERPRQNSHYEYQPVGPYNNKSSNSDGPRDSTDNSGARVRARGQNHSRRGGGNFYGRQTGV